MRWCLSLFIAATVAIAAVWWFRQLQSEQEPVKPTTANRAKNSTKMDRRAAAAVIIPALQQPATATMIFLHGARSFNDPARGQSAVDGRVRTKGSF